MNSLYKIPISLRNCGVALFTSLKTGCTHVYSVYKPTLRVNFYVRVI